MYSFSFEQNPRWTRSFSPQPEIWDYLRDGHRPVRPARPHPLRRRGHRRPLGRRRAPLARHDRPRATYTARFLVSRHRRAAHPQHPEAARHRAFPRARRSTPRGGTTTSTSPASASPWSAPAPAPSSSCRGSRRRSARLTLFQRTPPWIMPKPDHAMPGWAKTLFRLVPGAQRLYRERHLLAARGPRDRLQRPPGADQAGVEARAGAHAQGRSRTRSCARKLTPDYAMGCKRVLVANDYYPALTRDNVEREHRRHPRGHRARDRRRARRRARGRRDHLRHRLPRHRRVRLPRHHRRATAATSPRSGSADGIQTHLGITVAGFPNLFFLLGPNTGLGHNSVVFMIESQIRYVAQAMALADAGRRGGARHQGERAGRSSSRTSSASWPAACGRRAAARAGTSTHAGVNRTIWPGFTWRYWLRTRKLDPATFELVG